MFIASCGARHGPGTTHERGPKVGGGGPRPKQSLSHALVRALTTSVKCFLWFLRLSMAAARSPPSA